MRRDELTTLSGVCRALGLSEADVEDSEMASIVTDTRQLVPGSLFVALRGERFDAHDFVSQARQAGAIAAVVERAVDDPLPQLVVGDTRMALGLLARAHRRAWKGPIVAVTGNSGKTTVKQMLATLLGRAGSTLATQGK